MVGEEVEIKCKAAKSKEEAARFRTINQLVVELHSQDNGLPPRVRDSLCIFTQILVLEDTVMHDMRRYI